MTPATSGRPAARICSLARPTAALSLCLVATSVAVAREVPAQVVDDRMVPGGAVRLSGWPAFSAWEERFGSPTGGSERTPLGAGLTAPSALDLFPGGTAWVESLRALADDPSYTPVLGPTVGRLSHDVTRIDIGLDVGITDWWTVGATLPRIKNRTVIDVVFVPDTVAGNVGVSPVVAQPAAVDGLLMEVRDQASAARARAATLCADDDPACGAATSLAEETERVGGHLATAYGALPFFPLGGSTTGDAVSARIAALDADLRAAGLAGITTPLVLSAGAPTQEGLEDLPVLFAPLGYAEPLRSRTDLWGAGDIELRTLVRMLRLGDRGGEVPPWTVDVLGGAVLRLGTGSAPSADVPYALGTGEGQTDVELRLSAHATAGKLLSVRLGGLYGRQGARTLVRRVDDGDTPLALHATRTVGEWSPGSYWGIEMEPGLRLASQLTVSGTFRLHEQAGDTFEPAGGSAVTGRGMGVQHVGAALEYDTTEPGTDGIPVRFRIRWMRAVAGDGGAPATTRIELAGELFRRLWGEP